MSRQARELLLHDPFRGMISVREFITYAYYSSTGRREHGIFTAMYSRYPGVASGRSSTVTHPPFGENEGGSFTYLWHRAARMVEVKTGPQDPWC